MLGNGAHVYFNYVSFDCECGAIRGQRLLPLAAGARKF
jgi:hypothetical protein